MTTTPTEVSTADLLRLTGVPRRTLTRWTEEGVIKPLRRGKWDLGETLKRIVGHLRVHQVGGERERLLREQTRYRRLKNDELERTLVPSEDCRSGYVELAGMFVAGLDALGPRLATEVTGVDEPGQVREIVRGETHRLRSELADRLEQVIRELANE